VTPTREGYCRSTATVRPSSPFAAADQVFVPTTLLSNHLPQKNASPNPTAGLTQTAG
jgi:hypothetical protein